MAALLALCKQDLNCVQLCYVVAARLYNFASFSFPGLTILKDLHDTAEL